MMNGLSISLLFIMLLPIFIIITFISYWTRKTERFGVSIPEHVYNDPNLQSLRKGYVYRTVILSVFHTLILLILFLMTNFTEQTLITFYSVSIFIYLIISFFIYLIYHRKMKELKQYKGWFRERKQQTFIYTKFREQKLTVSHYLFAIPFILSLITIGWTLMNYDLFPNKIPMNYSLTGEVTNWVEKSYRSILLMPSTQFILTIIFVAVNI